CYFFIQAEDGIRDRNVTGVQTCALPISEKMSMMIDEILDSIRFRNEVIENRDQKTDLKASIEKLLEKIRVVYPDVSFNVSLPERSEERRVGKEGRRRWVPEQL